MNARCTITMCEAHPTEALKGQSITTMGEIKAHPI